MPMSGMSSVACVGIGRVPFTRDRLNARSPLSMAAAATRAAAADAGLSIDKIDGIACYGMNDTAAAGLVAQAIGLNHLDWHLDVYAGGFGSFTSLAAAQMALNAGVCTYAVVYRSLAGYTGSRYASASAMQVMRTHPDQEFDAAAGYAIPPQWFAMWAKRHQFEVGTTEEDLGAVAINTRVHASRNEHAVMRHNFDIDEYLASRMISEPLKVLDCSLEVDGAVALILTTPERAADGPHRPVYLHGGEYTFNNGGSWNSWPDFTRMYPALIAEKFWNRFGIRPGDIDVACMYDCFTITVLATMEGFGFFDRGEGGDFFREGRATYGGDVVVNPHGGLLSEGYIHGFNHQFEAVQQLRGEAGDRQVHDSSTALVTSGAGPFGGAVLYTTEVSP